MKENKQDQAGENKGSVNQDKASTVGKPGELSIEELAKVSGGRVIGIRDSGSNYTRWTGPLGNTSTKG